MISTVIILGEHIQALGLARQAHSLGLKVVLAVRNWCSVARFSNSVDRTFFYSDDDSLTRILLDHKGINALLLPTSDDLIEYLNNNRNELEPFFIIGIPSKECIRLFTNKRNTYRFCEKEGIPHPKSYYPNSLEEAASIAEVIQFPVIIKPAVMYRFHALTKKKAILCHDKDELIRNLKALSDRITVQELLIQEFLQGGAASLYSYGTFAVNGVPKCWIMANRIRQNPMDFGNSTTFAISCDIPDIEQSAQKILRLTTYTGLAEVEFMYDANSKTYKFLEINTRAWKWHSISNGSGFGFFSEMLRYHNGCPSEFQTNTKTIAWVEVLTDSFIILKEVIKGKMSFKKALASYRIPKTRAVWDKRDPVPAIMYLLLSPILFFKRH